jgi:hypothetical protein
MAAHPTGIHTASTNPAPEYTAQRRGAGLAIPAAEFHLGRNGKAAPLMGEGWSDPEEGFTWTTGTHSRLRLPVPRGHAPLLLELSLHGFHAAPRCPSQHLTVTLNGTTLGHAEISGPTTLGFPIPAAAASGFVLDITLLHPDAISPEACGLSADRRELALAVSAVRLWRLPQGGRGGRAEFLPLPRADTGAALQRASGLTPAALVERFVSLGQNCEFGLMQRMAGAEPLGLLRFAGIDLPNLLRGLEDGFADVENPEFFDFKSGMFQNRMEYLVHIRRHGIRLHTHIFVDETKDIDAVALRVMGYLRFLQRHFVNTLQQGGRIFVLQHPAVTTAMHALPVLARLAAHGDNRLLYVTEQSRVPPGTVWAEQAGLYRGAIDGFVPPDEAWRINVPAWLSLCANVWQAEHSASVDRKQGERTRQGAALADSPVPPVFPARQEQVLLPNAAREY